MAELALAAAVSAGLSPKDLLHTFHTIDKVIQVGNDLISQSNVNIYKNKIIPFHCSLAPSFGKLSKESIKTMDDNLKIIIAGTTRELSKMVKEAHETNESMITTLSWEKVIGLMSQSSLLEPYGSVVQTSDNLIKKGIKIFKFDGSPSSSVVNEVKTWFRKLLNDDNDVLSDTNIDINTMAKIVAQTGATVTDFVTLFHKDEHEEQQVVDIGILRYPDIDHPYFKVYRIKLKAWSRSIRTLAIQEDSNGIIGEFFSQKFKPRDSVINEMSKEVRKKAVREAEDIFNW